MIRSIWDWLMVEHREKSLTRQLTEIGVLYAIFLGISLIQDEIPPHWLLISAVLLLAAFWQEGRELVRIGLMAAVIVFGLVRPFVVQAFYIPSRSMENTLLVNDHIFVNKFIYRLSKPERWDIIVFEYPNNPRKDYIKRLVGLPGDRIKIRDHKLFVNGRRIDRRYVHSEVEMRLLKSPLESSTSGSTRYFRFRADGIELNRQPLLTDKRTQNPVKIRMSIMKLFREAGNHTIKEMHVNGRDRQRNYSESFGPLTVPKKGQTVDLTALSAQSRRYFYNLIQHKTSERVTLRDGIIYKNGVPVTEYTVKEKLYFVLGDNRDHSEDSRVWGFVPQHRLLGEAFFVYWPLTRIGTIGI